MVDRIILDDIVEGDNADYTFNFTDPQTGDRLDITGWKIWMSFADMDSGQIVLQDSVSSHIGATNGRTKIEFDNSQTAGITGRKRYDVQVKDDNNIVTTIMIGTVEFIDGVTDSA